ncbi:MAG: DUF1365 domain-containing protein [Alphaproteobacteria bacterium]|nr:DUF1365 domain-containing protein [Alphaproteobacteria bacterium]
MNVESGIYRGSVVHQRLRPKRHRLRYRVFSLLLDLDELPALGRRFRLFAHNRWAPLAFHDRDHGPTTGDALRPWVEARLSEAGLRPDGGPIRLLCYPRIFGYAFNPLSVYFCYRRDGAPAAILYEVCNTFRERHTYIVPVERDDPKVVRQRCEKAHYVSPFIAMDTAYHFRILPPSDRVSIAIRQEDAEGLLLTASFGGKRQTLTDGALLRCLVDFPFMTLKVIAAIHWEALLLWLKGLRVIRRDPRAPRVGSSVERVKATKV